VRFPVRHLFQREGALVIGGENFRVRACRIRRGASQVAREGAVELLIAIVRRHGALPSENVSGTVSCRNSRRFLSAKTGFAGLLLRKQIPEINGSVFGGVLKAKRNFRFAEGRLAMQMFLDARAANSCRMRSKLRETLDSCSPIWRPISARVFCRA